MRPAVLRPESLGNADLLVKLIVVQAVLSAHKLVDYAVYSLHLAVC